MPVRRAVVAVVTGIALALGGMTAPAAATPLAPAAAAESECEAACNATFDAAIAGCAELTGSARTTCRGEAWGTLINCAFKCGWHSEEAATPARCG